MTSSQSFGYHSIPAVIWIQSGLSNAWLVIMMLQWAVSCNHHLQPSFLASHKQSQCGNEQRKLHIMSINRSHHFFLRSLTTECEILGITSTCPHSMFHATYSTTLFVHSLYLTSCFFCKPIWVFGVMMAIRTETIITTWHGHVASCLKSALLSDGNSGPNCHCNSRLSASHMCVCISVNKYIINKYHTCSNSLCICSVISSILGCCIFSSLCWGTNTSSFKGPLKIINNIQWQVYLFQLRIVCFFSCIYKHLNWSNIQAYIVQTWLYLCNLKQLLTKLERSGTIVSFL